MKAEHRLFIAVAPFALLPLAFVFLEAGVFSYWTLFFIGAFSIVGLWVVIDRFVHRLSSSKESPKAFTNDGSEGVRSTAHESCQVEVQSQAEVAARSASAAKSDFLATMSHEIRTPMNGVLGMADDLLSLEMPREQRDKVEMIKISGESLMRILDDILDLSKIEAGKLEVRNSSYDFHLACRTVHTLFQTRANEKNLEYSYSISDDVPCFVIGDSVRTRQIISNFISNAIKFTKSGSVLLDVSIEKRNESGILIQVTDTGSGISTDQVNRVFDAYSQLEENRNNEVLGTGLGLAISKRLARLMHGSIELTSTLGAGSTFGLWIPLLEGESVGGGLLEIPADLEVLENVRILLVEDNLINQHVICSILDGAKHDVSVASNGFEALDVIQSEPLDLILMDCRMPKLNGFETTERVRLLPLGHFNREVPIVALTAGDVADDREKCFKSGMNDFLTKPVSRNTLLRMANFYGQAQREVGSGI